MLQSVFLNITIKLSVFAMQISGLWPFAYDHKAKKFKFLWYLTILPIVIVGYPFVVAFFWSKRVSKDIFVKNTFVLMISFTFLTFNALNFVIMFVCHYFKIKKMKNLILRMREMIGELNNELDSSEFRYENLLLKFFIKTVVLMCIMTYSIFQSMQRYTKFNEDYVLHIMSALPNLIMKLQPDAFFCALLVIKFYLTRINDKVSRVLTKAKDLSEDNDLDEQKRYQKMINFCGLSDRLDRLCVLQCSVVEISESFVQMFSFQITIWMALGLIVILVNLFQEYISITTSIRHDDFSAVVFINDLLAAVLVITEIYMTSAASDSVMTEGRKTGILLNTPLMRRNMDVRFKRSVEIYSGQILLKSFNITGSGLFPIDATLMYSLVSAVTSYLVILIQFELKLWKTN